MEPVKRDIYLNRLIERKENGLIKVVTGIRRCGKSYFLFKLFYGYLQDSRVDASRIITIPLDDGDYEEGIVVMEIMDFLLNSNSLDL